MIRGKNSILFVRPDYHCSFIYREQFRKEGWKADIYLPQNYPNDLLFADVGLLRPPKINNTNLILLKILNHILLILWWLTKFWRYEYHCYYGEPPVVSFIERRVGLTYIFGDDFCLELWLAKLFGIKLIFLSPGCRNDESKENFSLLDNGNVCRNCGYWDKCIDEENKRIFDIINRYFDLSIGIGSIDSTQYRMTHFKYKSIDLNMWHPELEIPEEHQLPATKNIRIMHSAYLEKSGRDWKGKNIKGSPYILSAIERLKSEGYPVEYFYVKDKPSNQMRYYQVQADIIVEQLIFGWWGSTFVETSALGKPVVCYLRHSWKEFFHKTFPEYTDLPIIEANTRSIYDVLKKLVINHEYRKQKGEEARLFAEAHFDSQKNTSHFIKILQEL